MQEHNSNTIASVPLDDLIALYAEEQQLAEPTLRQSFVALRSLRDFSHPNAIETLNDINRPLLVRWRTWLIEYKNRSPSTWNSYRSHLFAVLRWCELQHWDSGITMQGIKAMNVTGTKKKTLERIGLRDVMRMVEEDKISGAYPGWFWSGAMRFLFFSGVRRRQLVGLTWGDLDFKRMTILLRAEHSKTKREWTIPLAPALLPFLAELKEKTEVVMQERYNRRTRRSDQLFNCSLFSPYYRSDSTSVENVSQVFRRIREKTGFKISAHKFRHTFATKLAKEGDLKELQHILGHTNLSTTMSYVEADVSRMRNMLGGLGNDI